MPIYHLMFMSLCPQGFDELDRIARDFLWGTNKLGEFCKPVVAWKDIAHRKATGGIKIDDLHNSNLVLKMCWAGRILQDDPAAWVRLAYDSIDCSLNSGFRHRTRRLWSVPEAILLDERLHVSGSPLLCDILRGFNLAKKSLNFEKQDFVLPLHLTVEQLLLLFKSKDALTPTQERSVLGILGILRFHGVVELGDLWNIANCWHSAISFCQSTGVTRQGDNLGLVWLLGNLAALTPCVVDLKFQNSNGWAKSAERKLVKSWSPPNLTWNRLIVSPRTDFAKLNYRWNVDSPEAVWIHFWKCLKGSLSFHIDKIIIWRVLHHGYFHHRRARIWGVHSRACPCCNVGIELITHLFFGCRNLQRRWATIAVLFAGSPLAHVFCHDSL